MDIASVVALREHRQPAWLACRGCGALLLLALGFGLSTVLSAASAQPAGSAATGSAGSAGNAANSGKIGIVNIQQAIIATNEGKKEFDALQQRFAPKQKLLPAEPRISEGGRRRRD